VLYPRRDIAPSIDTHLTRSLRSHPLPPQVGGRRGSWCGSNVRAESASALQNVRAIYAAALARVTLGCFRKAIAMRFQALMVMTA